MRRFGMAANQLCCQCARRFERSSVGGPTNSFQKPVARKLDIRASIRHLLQLQVYAIQNINASYFANFL